MSKEGNLHPQIVGTSTFHQAEDYRRRLHVYRSIKINLYSILEFRKTYFDYQKFS